MSSGALPSAIAIVRISGPRARDALDHLAGAVPEVGCAALRTLRHDGEILDQAMLLWFAGPRTVTGEDVAEIHLHGSRAVVDACFAALQSLGLRMADPGEFTRRALFNGKMDLSAVEGLADLLAAETESQRRDAIRRQRGFIPQRLHEWRSRLTHVAAAIEAAIDYDGEEEVGGDPVYVIGGIRTLLREIERVLALAPAERLREGIRVAIIGPPNAGKSTLFNQLIGRDAAIVSDIAGTTRDVIECPIAIDGIPFLLVDTAGLRTTADPIEKIGVGKARDEAELADILVDLAADRDSERCVAVSAKADVTDARPGTLAVSVHKDTGIVQLQERLVEMAAAMIPLQGEVAFDRRYRQALAAVRNDLSVAVGTTDPLLVAEHIRLAIRELDRVLGGDGVEDMLDALFGRFCLGK
ncbi:tRNA uridine-5-carboxymethylaminomethyl(34) synthesis GTPase MnmE [Sphingomonas sp. CGMCC 1.13654]|uniref:tRNA modification GTPase MnmE n=1 Tax=Sphingomonas chungangi TaxID=2683589 RepID=A0A838LBJ4_9SPHN|nr:tRNA uridine-5-carboxymethylaminomethyl(34) synthesis GTPase MnmE [Sphingomonas chungangi]MVW57013.1 tRNA uridine-5-carboxymethylaminomethyl(34) synthesis GTPase MnmE [Sphingomonas chungangi]